MVMNCKTHPCFPAGVRRSPFRSVCLQKPVFSPADAADAWGGWGSRFQTQICFLDFSDVCLSKCQVMWIIAKEGLLTGQKQACSKIARCWGVRSSQCKNGLKHNRMVFWWRPSNQSHDQTRPIPNYLHINKERGIVFPVSLLPSWHWVLFFFLQVSVTS